MHHEHNRPWPRPFRRVTDPVQLGANRTPAVDRCYRRAAAPARRWVPVARSRPSYRPHPGAVVPVHDPPGAGADGAGGREYPALVTTEGDTVLARPGLRWPEYIPTHEVGHNWFQGFLRSNEADRAWSDDG